MRETCEKHGLQEGTFVCQHIVQGLATKTRVGFFWSVESPEMMRPDSCCFECNERVKATNGEWVGEVLELAKPQPLCGACYDLARVFHMGGDPWS